MAAGTRPGVRLLYAAAVAIAWGLVCGALRAPAWMVMPGGLGAAALGVRLEWTALTQPVAGRTTNQGVLIAAAFGFLALVGVGIASLGCIVGLELAARLGLR